MPAEEDGQMTTAERIASVTRLLAMNRAMGYPEYPGLANAADAFTRSPTETRRASEQGDEDSDTETIETMPSLEPRECDEENDESVSTINSTDEEVPSDLPSDDDTDEPDMPLLVTDPVENEEQDDALEQVAHDAPPSDVEVAEDDSVSILEGVEEADAEWTTVPNPKAKYKPHTVTRSGRKC